MIQNANTSAAENYVTVDPKVFSKEIDSPNVVVVDVRPADLYNEGHIKGAINLDVENPDFLKEATSKLPKDKTVAVYCGLGIHSPIAARELTKEGYNILNLDGGIKAWKEADLPVVK